jgi:uncharacterized RDD family membrane protein YckC
MWKDTPFARLDVLPRNLWPLTNTQFWNSRDDALTAVMTDIYSSLNQLVQSGGVQLSSTDAAKPRPDTAFTSKPAENQAALLHSTPQEAARSTTEQRVLAAQEKDASDISRVSEVTGSAAEAGSPISVDWRKKYYRKVVLKRGAAYLIDSIITYIIALIVIFVTAFASWAIFDDTFVEVNMGLLSVFGFGVTFFIICPMMESSRWRGTFGKIIMRIQITDRDGNRITFWRAFLRNVTRAMFPIIYLTVLGFIWQIVRFRKTKKLFHDEWSGTVIGERLAGVKTPRLAVSREANPADKKGALLTGLKLSRMRARLEAHPQDLTTQERDFGQATIEHGDAEDRRKARQRRIITRASIAAAVVLACLALAAGVAWNQAEQNAKQADVAKAEAENQTQLANEAKEQADKVAKQAEFERDKAIAALCLRVGRDLTKADWGHYFGDTPWQPSCSAFGVPSNWQRQPADDPESVAFAPDDAPAEAQPAAPPTSAVLPVPPASAEVSLAPVFGDSGDSGEPRVVATPVAPKAPWPRPPRHPHHVTHAAPHGNMPTLTGNTTAQLNQQELTRQKSVVSTPDNIISGFFRSLFR